WNPRRCPSKCSYHPQFGLTGFRAGHRRPSCATDPGADLVVHDVAQTEDELRCGTFRLERVQTVAKFSRDAERFMIHQHQVWGQTERGVPQELASYPSEVLQRSFLVGLRPLERARRQTGGQFE